MTGLIVLSVVLTMVAAPIWSGYVLAILWGWFVVPTFGAPALPLTTAIGVALVVAYLTHQYTPPAKKEGSDMDRVGHALSYVFARPALALLFGWIVKQFA